VKVFVGPTEIAGIAAGVVKGLRELGVDAEAVFAAKHPFGYGIDTRSWLLQVWQRLGAARTMVSRRKLLQKLFLIAAHTLWCWFVLAKLVWRFDAYIFLYGQTITNTRFELWLLKFLGRKLIFIYVGSDSRPPYMDGGRYPGEVSDPTPAPSELSAETKRCKRRVMRCEAYATYVVNMPATGQFHERPFINWFAVGLPKVAPEVVTSSPRINGAVRVLHAPSNPSAKGTEIILEAIERLRSKGHFIEFIKVQDMTNQQVLNEIANCDFVIDQLYSDTPMGGFVAEAACFGKPAVVGGYFAAHIGSNLAIDTPPSMFVLPENIEIAIERLIVDIKLRAELGEKARQFVVTRWNPKAVAERYLMLLRGDIPESWWCQPNEISYLEGSGMSRLRAQRLVKELLGFGGASALQIRDKPKLERALFDFQNG
jgi:glycosyltransferase involved in cell wall biosynthesis